MINHEGELIWRNNIMQNGENPFKAKINQLKFYNIITEKLEYGFEAMFHPYSGRLAYRNKRIAYIFSYKNNYEGKDEDGIDNSADLIITYSEDGTEVNLVCPWSTSHSLCQRALFDGKYFFTASLGDSEPQNIKIVRFDSNLPIIQKNLIKMKIRIKNILKIMNQEKLKKKKNLKKVKKQKKIILKKNIKIETKKDNNSKMSIKIKGKKENILKKF